MSAPTGGNAGRLATRVVAACYLLVSFVVVLAGLALSEYECDEGCDPAPGPQPWYETETAWQWQGQLVIVAVAAAGFVAAAVLLLRRRRLASVVVGLLASALTAWWYVAIYSHGYYSLDYRDLGAGAGLAVMGYGLVCSGVVHGGCLCPIFVRISSRRSAATTSLYRCS